MSAPNDGGPAFPQARVWNAERAEYENTQQYPGMSLRAYFAAHAPVSLQDARYACGYYGFAECWGDAERAASMAVLALMRAEYADAMIASLKVQP